MDAKLFGEKLKELRKSKKLTQLSLAKKLNVSDKLISKWENGLSIPNVEMLNEICKFFEIDVNVMLQLEKYNNSKSDKFSKKSRKIVITTVLILFSAILILLSYFHFVPMIFKGRFLSQLTDFNDNNFDNGYFNFDLSMSIKEETFTESHKGIVNENKMLYEIKKDNKNELLFFNSVLIDYNRNTKSVLDASEVSGAKDLFELINKFNQEELNFNKDNFKIYKIRKVASKYKIFFKMNYSYADVKFKKGIFECFIEGDRISKIDFRIKLFIDDESYTATGVFNFYDEIPQINLDEDSKSFQWNINETSITQLPSSQIGGEITTKSFTAQDFVGYENYLIYYQNNLNQYNITILDLNTNTENIILSSYDIGSLNLYFVYDNKLYFKLKKESEYYICTYDFTSQQFETLDIVASYWTELLLFDDVFIYERLSISESVSLDGNLRFKGKIVYKNKNQYFSFEDKTIYEYNDGELINKYTSLKFTTMDRIYLLDNEYYLFVDLIGNGALFDKDLTFITDLPRVNLKFAKVLNVCNDKIYNSNGIMYSDLIKPPIVFLEEIEDLIILDNYFVFINTNVSNDSQLYIVKYY